LSNPARVAEKQKPFITFVAGRYTPVLGGRKIGISFLRDTQAGDPDAFLGEAEKMEVEKAPLEKVVEASKKKEDDELAPPE
jgi:hypothetical protein